MMNQCRARIRNGAHYTHIQSTEKSAFADTSFENWQKKGGYNLYPPWNCVAKRLCLVLAVPAPAPALRVGVDDGVERFLVQVDGRVGGAALVVQVANEGAQMVA